jgi:peroxiredoxin
MAAGRATGDGVSHGVFGARRGVSRAPAVEHAVHGSLGVIRLPLTTQGPTSPPDTPTERTYAMRSDIAPGGTFPDYELPDHDNVPRRLSELQGDDPMILTLARGHYCPKEHQQHLELAAFYPKIAVAYTKIATVATDEHHTLQEFRASVGAQWPFLSDPGRIVQKDLDIQEYTDPDNDPMIPHTLVLKPGLVIHSVYNGYWFWGRPSVVDLWHDLRAVTREVRPDWDLSTPGLREAWDAGELSPFHGWDKRTAAAESAT